MLPSPPPVHRAGKQHPPLVVRGLKGIGWVLFWSFVIGAVLLATVIYIVPQAKAGAGLTVLTGSMVPAYKPGDVVAVKGIKPHEVCASLKPGQVITFMPNADDDMLVTHRVVSVSETVENYEDCTVTTRGDANNVDDEPIPAKAVKGVVMYHVPYVGYAISKMKQTTDERNVAIGGAALFMTAAFYFMTPRREKTRNVEWHI
jgi:signal peptidase